MFYTKQIRCVWFFWFWLTEILILVFTWRSNRKHGPDSEWNWHYSFSIILWAYNLVWRPDWGSSPRLTALEANHSIITPTISAERLSVPFHIPVEVWLESWNASSKLVQGQIIRNKMHNKKYHTVGTVSKPNRKAQKYMTAHFLGLVQALHLTVAVLR